MLLFHQRDCYSYFLHKESGQVLRRYGVNIPYVDLHVYMCIFTYTYTWIIYMAHMKREMHTHVHIFTRY